MREPVRAIPNQANELADRTAAGPPGAARRCTVRHEFGGAVAGLAQNCEARPGARIWRAPRKAVGQNEIEIDAPQARGVRMGASVSPGPDLPAGGGAA